MLFDTMIVLALLYCVGAWWEGQFYLNMCKRARIKPQLTLVGLFIHGLQWPKWRYIWWRITRRK